MPHPSAAREPWPSAAGAPAAPAGGEKLLLGFEREESLQYAGFKEDKGDRLVIRYNAYPAADIAAGVNPAVLSSTQALEKVRGLAAQVLPRGMDFEWTGLTYQQATQGNTAILVFPLCVLLVFLVLAAQYESFKLPLAIIMIVPMCILSALAGVWLSSFPPFNQPGDLNIFTQVALVVLVGLACKNAILIVEFAKELEERGRALSDAIVEACRLRLRPILMTSIAFCAGVLPLIFGSGAGSEMRRAMGIAVFAGMVGVTQFGIFLTPVFYALLRKGTERRRALAAARRAEVEACAHPYDPYQDAGAPKKPAAAE